MNTVNAEYEYLALVINYNDLLKRTIIKKEYFEGKDKILFEIITKEYKKNSALVLTELVKYNNFDLDYYMELLENNLYNSSREKQFKILEKQIIENFKNRQLKKIIELYSGNIEEFYKQIDKVRELNVEENEYITAEDIINTLDEENSQVKLGFSDLDKALYISQNDFVVLAGGTGTGKTTFALNLLRNLSKEYQCVYFNMEMSKKTLYKRLSAIETGININKFNDIRTLETKEVKFLYQKISEIEERKIILINSYQNIDKIEKII